MNKETTNYHYEIRPANKVVRLELPIGAKNLSALIFDNQIRVYAEVNPEIKVTEVYEFAAWGTGIVSDRIGFTYLGVVSSHEWHEVYHIYYRKLNKRP